jgi:hypothetical protein
MTSSIAPIGHNNPPTVEEEIHRKLLQDYADEFAMAESLLAKADDLPPEVNNDDQSGQYSDFLKRLKGSEKMLDGLRKTEKEVYSVKANAVHNFFKKKIDMITDKQKDLSDVLAKYLAAKEDERRRAAAEKAAAERAEAERKMREAEAAAEIAREAQRKAEAEARAAEAAAEAARQKAAAEAAEARRKAEEEAAEIRRKAEEERAKQQAEIDRMKAEAAKAQEAEEMSKREAQRQIREAEERQKEAERAAKASEKEAKEKIEQAERDAKEAMKAAREIERDAEIKAYEASKEANALQKDANRSLDQAARASKFADKTERQTASATTAEMSRTRGDSSMASITEKWVGRPIGREELFQSAALLWDHIPYDALEQAVQSAVNAGERIIPGANVFQETKAVVR